MKQLKWYEKVWNGVHLEEEEKEDFQNREFRK